MFFTERHTKLFSAGTNGGTVTVKLVVLERCGTWDRTIARKSTVRSVVPRLRTGNTCTVASIIYHLDISNLGNFGPVSSLMIYFYQANFAHSGCFSAL